jgi:hypothetical protein
MKFYSELSEDEKNKVIGKLMIFPFTSFELETALEKTNPAFTTAPSGYMLFPKSYKKLFSYLNEYLGWK